MIYAVISDLHANLEATESCFEEIDKIKPDKIICLGDLIDYCAQPNEVIDIARRRSDIILLGNHDEAQLNYQIAEGFTQNALISSVHTRSVLKKGNKDFISSLPRSHSENNLLFVHGAPCYLPEYGYIIDEHDARENFSYFKESICFVGHSHLPVVFEENNGKIKIAEPGTLDKASRYIINIGSVGQPRDGDPRLAFGLFDTEQFEFKQIRINYDIETAAKKIINEGLPFQLAKRLFVGM